MRSQIYYETQPCLSGFTKGAAKRRLVLSVPPKICILLRPVAFCIRKNTEALYSIGVCARTSFGPLSRKLRDVSGARGDGCKT